MTILAFLTLLGTRLRTRFRGWFSARAPVFQPAASVGRGEVRRLARAYPCRHRRRRLWIRRASAFSWPMFAVFLFLVLVLFGALGTTADLNGYRFGNRRRGCFRCFSFDSGMRRRPNVYGGSWTSPLG